MNRKSDVRAAVVLVLVMLLGLLILPSRRADAMVPEDILTMRAANPVDLSPDGRYLLYTLTRNDPQDGRRLTTMSRRDLRTGKDLLMFSAADQAWGAVWRPDGGAVAYLHAGEEGTELWLMDPDGGDRRRVDAAAEGFGSLVWAPGGDALAWVTEARVGEYAGEPGRVVVAEDLGYRHLNAGYREGARGQLFVLELDGGEVRRLVEAPLDVRGACWSPAGDRLVFAAKAEADLGWNLNTDLWTVPRGGGDLRRLTANPGRDEDPRWLPEGRIAYLRTTDPLWESAPPAIAVIDAEQGDAGHVTLHGEGFGNFFWRWDTDGARFFILGANRGCLDLVEVAGDQATVLTDGGHDYWSVQVRGPRVILSGAGQTLPGAIFTVDLAEKIMPPHHPTVVIDPNESWRQKVGLTDPEPFAIDVDGRTIEGWFFKPEGLEEGQRAPAVLSIHGGPEWMYGGYFLPEFHILPTYGYGVIIANPTGSLGYGVEFQRGIRGDWVDRPSRELLACVDLAIEQGWADPQRLAVMGGSYGGLLGAELTTRTDRFRAAALDRMFPDQIAFWGTTDEKWFPEWEFMGRPWEPAAREIYLRNSPSTRVGRVRTPTLISQGMLDYRCLIAGGEIWFSSLLAQGVPARFLRFENEGHGIRDPQNQAFYQRQVLDWFDRHVLGLHEPDPETIVPDPVADHPVNE